MKRQYFYLSTSTFHKLSIETCFNVQIIHKCVKQQSPEQHTLGQLLIYLVKLGTRDPWTVPAPPLPLQDITLQSGAPPGHHSNFSPDPWATRGGGWWQNNLTDA